MDPDEFVSWTAMASLSERPRSCMAGCQAAALTRLAEQAASLAAELIEKEKKRMKPTQSLWCEQGGHPFSEKDPGLQVLTISGRGEDGQPAEESRTCCGPCATLAKTRLGQPQQAQQLQLPPQAAPGNGYEPAF